MKIEWSLQGVSGNFEQYVGSVDGWVRFILWGKRGEITDGFVYSMEKYHPAFVDCEEEEMHFGSMEGLKELAESLLENK